MTCEYCGHKDAFYWKSDKPYCGACHKAVYNFTVPMKELRSAPNRDKEMFAFVCFVAVVVIVYLAYAIFWGDLCL